MATENPYQKAHTREHVHADRVGNIAPRLKIRNKINETNVKCFIPGKDALRVTIRMLRERRKHVRGGGLKKAYSSLVTVFYCSPCVFLVSVCQFTDKKKGAVGGGGGVFLELSGPGLIWDKDRAALNLIPFDSRACTRTTHIKSAC